MSSPRTHVLAFLFALILCSSNFDGIADAAGILNQDGTSTSGIVHGKPLGKRVLLHEFNFTDVVAAATFNFRSGVFDGTYVWLIPAGVEKILRIDIRDQAMTAFGGWPAGVVGNASKFKCGAFDGTKVWLVPFDAVPVVSVNTDGTMAKYDDWPTGAGADLSVADKAFNSAAIIDGILYMIPWASNRVVSLITANVTMAIVASNDANVNFDLGSGQDYRGSASDGSKLFLPPAGKENIASYDPVTGDWESFSNWPTEITTAGQALKFYGASYDGTFIWLIPFNAAAVVRLDPGTGAMQGYNNFPSGIGTTIRRFAGACFDGEAIWMVPRNSDVMVRIDTADGSMLGYSDFPASSQLSSAFTGCVYDGTNIWLSPVKATAIVRVTPTTRSESATHSASLPETCSDPGTASLSMTTIPTQTNSFPSTPTVSQPATMSTSNSRSQTGSPSLPPTPSSFLRALKSTVTTTASPPPAVTVTLSNTANIPQNTTTNRVATSTNGTTAGIVVGVLLCLIILVLIAVVLIQGKNRRKEDSEYVKEIPDQLDTNDLLVASPTAEDTSELRCVDGSTGTDTTAATTCIPGLPESNECGNHHEVHKDVDDDEYDVDPRTDVGGTPGQVVVVPAFNEIHTAVNNNNSIGTVSNHTPGHPPSHGSATRISEGSSPLVQLHYSPGTSIHSINSQDMSTGSDVPGNPFLTKTQRRKLFHAAAPGTYQPIRFIKGQMIGSGGFGRVYQGLDEASGALIAAKEIVFDSNAGGSWDSHVLALRREIDVMKRLNHLNVVRYYGGAKEENSFYIFMEHVAGGSVRGILAHHGALSVTMARDFTTQMLDGLGHIHAHGLIHRDIKSANTLIDAKGIVKIIDFGTSRNSSTVTGTAGTPCWMAPEVLRGEAATAASDVWSVGCTVMEMLTGKTPWSHVGNGSVASTMYHIGREDELLQIPAFGSSVADEFVRLCLRRDPSERPTAEQLLEHAFCDCDIDEDGNPIDFQSLMQADIDAPNVVPPLPQRRASRPSSGTWRRCTPQPQSPVPEVYPPASSMPMEVVDQLPRTARNDEVDGVGAPIIGAGGGVGSGTGLPPRHPAADMDLSNMQRHSSVVVTASMIDVDADTVDTIVLANPDSE